jgi:hypothetical protein
MAELLRKYVIDAGPIIDLKHYYEDIFISLWDKFEELISCGIIISSIEVYRELKKHDDEAANIASKYKQIFLKPDIEEQKYVKTILAKHRELIRFKNIAGGFPVADPFIIAQAIHPQATLITSEKIKPNAHSIPNICKEYGVTPVNLNGFFRLEGWRF